MDNERLKELRKDRGKSQADMARELGVSLSAYKSYEQGRYNPSNDVLATLVKYFNISADYLLGVIDDEIPLRRKDAIDLPKGFPDEAIPELRSYMEFLINKFANNK